MKKWLSLCFLILILANVKLSSAQINTNHKSYAEAFNQVDHFYTGLYMGIPFPIMIEKNYNYQTESSSYAANISLPLLPSPLPSFRIFGGYKYKRHCFELGVENKPFITVFDKYDPGAGYIDYRQVYPVYYISTSYNIDLLKKQPVFKLLTGASMGLLILNSYKLSPGVGLNFMLEINSGRHFCFFIDHRYTVAILPFENRDFFNPYPNKYNISYQLMAFDINFGFKVKIYTKEKYRQGMGNYNQLINSTN